MTKTYIGDVGTAITLDCGADISSATGLEIRAKKPSGETVTWTASPSGTNSLTYTTEAGDIDESGAWSLQAYVEMPAWQGLGETFRLVVYRPYN